MEIEIHQLPENLDLSKKHLINVIKQLSAEINLKADSISYIFVDDDYLAGMHSRYLDDPAKTDVITFNLGDTNIEGEIYISYERAMDQALNFKVAFEEEIMRLLIHGMLHLAGYNDVQEADLKKMKKMENSLLNKYFKKV